MPTFFSKNTVQFTKKNYIHLLTRWYLAYMCHVHNHKTLCPVQNYKNPVQLYIPLYDARVYSYICSKLVYLPAWCKSNRITVLQILSTSAPCEIANGTVKSINMTIESSLPSLASSDVIKTLKRESRPGQTDFWHMPKRISYSQHLETHLFSCPRDNFII